MAGKCSGDEPLGGSSKVVGLSVLVPCGPALQHMQANATFAESE
jgi:hypothetical protein